LKDFKQNAVISENLYADADELPERPEPLDNPQYGLDDNDDDEGEEQEVIYTFIDWVTCWSQRNLNITITACTIILTHHCSLFLFCLIIYIRLL